MTSRPKAPLDDLPRQFFREEARSQRVCMSVDCTNPRASWQAHHVVYEQHLRRVGLPKFDKANVLRLCDRCHASHHNRMHVIKSRSLTFENMAFLLNTYAPLVNPSDPVGAALEYVARYYDVDGDPAVEKLACQ